MKIALMSGAYVNAGDFLIEHRSIELLKTFTDASKIDILKRDISYDDEIDRLNNYDMIIFGGGPGYQENIYPDRIPFVSRMDQITVPISIMGWGWKGKNTLSDKIYNYKLNDSTKRFLNHIENKGGYLGCRDWYTVRALKNIGFHNMVMTGCPAWYDLCKVENLCIKKFKREAVKTICISDVAFKCHKLIMKILIIYIRQRFPDANIGCAEGFSVYDDCDFHIGFRVHAHIYNLSRGNISILLNEDARGAGVNDALGILNIEMTSKKRIVYGKLAGKYFRDWYTILDDYFQYIYDTDFLQYEDASLRIKHYYKVMKKHLINLQSFN